LQTASEAEQRRIKGKKKRQERKKKVLDASTFSLAQLSQCQPKDE